MHTINLKNSIKIIDILKLLIILLPAFFITGVALVEVTIVLCSLYYLFSLIKDPNKFFPNLKYFNIYFFIFYISINLSVIFSEFFNILLIIKSTGYIRYFLFFYFINFFFKEEDLKFFFIFLTFCLAFLSFDIIYQFFFDKDILGIPPGMNGLRYSGFFGDELIAGGYIKNFAFISLSYLILNIKDQKLISILLFSIMFVAIILSGEKMSLILFLLGLLIFVYNAKQRIKIFFFIIFLLSFFLLIFKFSTINNISGETSKYDKIIYRYTTQFKNTLGFGSNSQIPIIDTVHATHFVTALEIFKNNIFFGSGLKTYRVACNTIDPEILVKNYNVSTKRAIHNRCTTHPHNFYLQLLSEIGLLGFFSFIFFNLYILFYWHYLQLDKKNLRGFYISYLLFIFPIATSGSLFNNYMSSMYWLSLSLILINFKKN